jgi:hypothetical protein
MAIFKGVGYFYFYIPEEISFAVFVEFSCTWLYFARFHPISEEAKRKELNTIKKHTTKQQI